MSAAPLEEIVEGRVRLLVPAGARKERGPGRREGDVFYNPAMALNRDVTVLVLDAVRRPGWRALDGLAASGIRGLRWKAEVPDVEVHLNDWNPVSAGVIGENARRNGLEVHVHHRNLGALLWERSWSLIDVDPFGSPMPFADAAARGVSDHGLVCLTATDSTALAGVYPDVCRRRYLAEPLHGEVGHEVALRILAGRLVRTAAKWDLSLTPVLMHATDHYYRVFARARKGSLRANEALSRLGSAWMCPACADRGLAPGEAPERCRACGGKLRRAGPLWAGPLHDDALLAAVAAKLPDHPDLLRREEVETSLALWRQEADAPPLFYEFHEASGRALVDPPKRDVLLEALRARGFRAVRTHMSPIGVKTDASEAQLRETLVEIGQPSARTRAR